MFLLLAMIDNEEDKSKFEQLYNQYKQLMFYIANGILHDENLAEDAVQHTKFCKEPARNWSKCYVNYLRKKR